MGKYDDIIVLFIGGIAGYFLLKNCVIQNAVNKLPQDIVSPFADILNQLSQFVGASCTVSGTAGGGGGGEGGGTPTTGTGGGGTPGATVQGDTPYPGGAASDMNDDGEGTRHYASGAPDDVTHEWSGETSAQSYMIVIDITLTEIDHDDTISFKFGGSHMGSGWYDCGYSFEGGQACIGKEEDHPSTDLCVVSGNSIGSLVNTPVRLCAVNISKGEKLEMWSNLGSGWTKDVEGGPGVGGFRPNESSDECVIRIDAAPGITMRSAQIIEMSGTTPAPSGGGGGTTTPAPTTPEAPASGNGNGNGGSSDYTRTGYVRFR